MIVSGAPLNVALNRIRKRGRNVAQQKLPLVRKEVFSTYDLGKVIPGLDKDWVQRMVQDEHLQIWPSVAPSTGVGTRKEWSRADVFGVALCWWLYNAGLRLDAIAEALLEPGTNLRGHAESIRREGSFTLKSPDGVVTVVPVKKLFAELESRMWE